MTDEAPPTAPDKPGSNKRALKNAGIAAAVLLAPGGFILGGLLIANAVKKRRAANAAKPELSTD
ncbi:MAG: hypothetical protein CVT77_00890 [Alphaproteobacteria bacterium HGW-Alphaproteobacteria-16]|nr:MAG: hypothetical protein CVT77_00890 [Alphaproteobacteria bacterium HGW-Alphaproteobacteria-16]